MAKSKILIKAAKPAANDDPPARPRTAAGDRGLLRRFRLGRILFGASPDADPSGRRGPQSLFRTNSVQAPAPDVPCMPAAPLPVYDDAHDDHVFSLRPRGPLRAAAESSADVRQSHYSAMSRRSSAPDVAEIARRLSRHVEEEPVDFASGRAGTPIAASLSTRHSPMPPASVLPLHMRQELSGLDGGNASASQSPAAAAERYMRPTTNGPACADAIEHDDCVFIPLSSVSRNRPSPVMDSTAVDHCQSGSVCASVPGARNAAEPPTPDMTRATLVWREPRPASQTSSMTSPSLPDSLPLPPDYLSEHVYSPEARSEATSQQEVDSTRHSSESDATQPMPQPSQFPVQPAPLVPSPLPAREPPAQALPATPRHFPGNADDRHFPPRRPNGSEGDCWPRGQLRPKSLHERPSCKALTALYGRDDSKSSSSRPSSSIASAKAFLMMIASGGGQSDLELNPGALTIITSDNISASSPTTPVPASAPIARSATSQTFEQHLTSSDSSTMIGGSESAAFEQPLDGLGLAGRRTSPSTSPGVPGNRSLRARSKLAGAGIRRASTYVWGRSSVFIKALSSTDELPVSAQLQPPPPPQQQQHPGPGAWESDVDTGSTKIDEATSLQGPVVAPVLADTPPEAAPEPIPRPVSSARPSKRSPAAMRLHASRELVMTEKNFVDNLFVIKKVWMEPVFSSANSPKPIIPYQAARVIFFGVAALHAHASHFYREMDYALGSYERGQGPVEGREDDGMRIGALFRANDRHWSDFIAYVRNYGAAMNCLKQLQDYKPYLRYHEECMMQKRTNRQSLKDLLMLPIQRITRYTLLLKNILKHTPAVHSDHIDLCRAVKNVTHFATIVNECRRKQEEMQRVAEVFRGIESCPPFPHAESRSFSSEFFVRELISRLPTRLLLFSDMLLVAQASPQVTIDDSGSADPEADWTYYGFASLDDVEVQNADESTSTLITILSLNRNLTSSDNHVASRPSLPFGTDSLANGDSSSSSELRGLAQNSPYCGGNADASDTVDSRGRLSAGSHHISTNAASLDTAQGEPSAAKKKKSKSRRGILNAGSRDSIPDHISALSHSTFPSPVPQPGQLERSQSRLHSMSPAPAGDYAPDRDTHQPPQRPKTASGHPGASFSAHHALALPNGSNSTLGSHGGPGCSGDLALSFRAQHPEHYGSTPSSTPTIAAGRTDVAPPRPAQLTLVMQHATSAMRKQFVRALKDATATLINDALGLCDSDAASGHPFGDSSSEVLNLHPL